MPKEPLPSYLHPNYDPTRDKMDRLREILIHNKVKTPSGNVRKQDFIDLFEQHIRPKIPALRKYRESIVPSEKGIIKVSATAGTSLWNHNPPEATTSASSKPLTTSSAGSSSRQQSESKTRSSSTLPAVSAVGRAPSPSKLTASREGPLGCDLVATDASLTEQRRRAKETDEALPAKGASRGRKKRAPSITKDESDANVAPVRVTRRKKVPSERKRAHSQNFSDENPFQSGSESERRRRSKSRDSSTSTSRSPSKSRRSRPRWKPHDEADRDHIFTVPSQPAFSHYMNTPKYSASSYDKVDRGGAPFHNSPLLAKSRRISAGALSPSKPLHFEPARFPRQGETAFKPYRNPRQPKERGPLRLVLFIAALIFGMWYRHTRFQIGFCTPANSPLSRTSPMSFQWIYPTCIPCPTHATCVHPNKEPICPPEYILRPHPLNPGNMLPLTPVCLLNKATEYQSLQVADVAEHMLHQRAAKEECRHYRQPPRTAEILLRQRISASDLKQQIESMKDSSISHHDFGQYWKLALKELGRRSDTVITEYELGNMHLRSLKPSKSLVCRMRQGIIGWLIDYQIYLLALIISAISGFLIRRRVQRRREENRTVQRLVDSVLSKLADQSHYYYIDPVLYPDPYLPQIHLRDALLTDVQQPARRQELWEKVSMVVDRNANVRVSAQEVRGEMYRVWEWIGASGVLGGKGMSPGGEGSGSNNGFRTSANSMQSPSGESGGSGDNRPTTTIFSLFEAMDRRHGSELEEPGRPLYPSLLSSE
ncbi:inner nuclear membrane protein enriched at telomere/subtelomere region [Mortierella claussenii]|nr:inner nuclear membrane protein enriched at telomere/subtelomere region [Mortierella claussenii]